MSSPAEPPSLILTRRIPDGALEWIPLEIPQRIPAVPGSAYALIDRADYEAPETLRPERVGEDLVIEVQGTEVLVLEGFFAIENVAFHPTTDIAGGAGPFSGVPLTPESPVAVRSPAGEQVASSSGEQDRDGEDVGAGGQIGSGGGSPLVWVGLAAGGLGLALAAGGGGSGGGEGGGTGGGGTGGGGGTPPPVQKTVQGEVTLGPVISGNGLTVEVFRADGTTKLGEASVGPDGRFSVNVGDYSGVIVARVTDANDNPDYLDEASEANKDLNAALGAVATVGSNSTVVININPVTTLASMLVGSGTPTSDQVARSNGAVAELFGLSDLHGIDVEPINGTGYDAGNGLSPGETYGAMLAAFSGATLNNGGNSQKTLDDVRAGLTLPASGAAQLNEPAQTLLIRGAETTERETGERIASIVTSVLDTIPPSITSGATAPALAENSGPGQVIYTATATDIGVVTFSLKAGDDAAAFSINANTGAVTLTGNPDFETKSSYSFTIVAADPADNRSERAVSLSIQDRDDSAPIFTSGATVTPIDENSGSGRVIYTAAATDAGSVTYSLKAGGDAAAFSINGSSGAVTLIGNPDHEAKSSYAFTVVATDDEGNTSEQAVSLAINDLDEVAPDITSGGTAPAINENSGAGQVIYTVTSTDTDDVSSGTTTYSLKPVGDSAAFSINANNGEVTLIANPDFEAKSSYSFTVVATDAAGNSSEQVVSLAINDTDDSAPFFTSGGTATPINENSGANQLVYTAVATDTSTVTYSLKSGGDAASFTINANTGAVRLTANPNFEAKSSYSFTVVATDTAGNSSEQAVGLTILDVDEIAPSFTSGTTATPLNENSGANQLVYTAVATDASPLTYSLKTGGDAADFTINATSGAVRLTPNPNFEAKSSYTFTVVATDSAGNSSERTVSLAINDVDEVAPTFTSGTTATAIDENSGANQLVYTAVATDASAVSYSLKAVGDAAAFTINSTTGAVRLTANPDFETKSSYSFTVVATDTAGNSSERAVSLAINNLDDTPPAFTSGGTAAPINENSGANQLVYTAVATDASAVSYSLKAGGDAADFTINATSGAVRLTANPNFETKSSYSFTVVATDTGGNSSERAVTLAINNLDEVAPTITSGATAAAINENSGANQVVYTVTSTDAGDISTGSTMYSLKPGGDAGAFTINGSTGAVRLTANPDFETKPSYSFTVIATDAAGNSSEQAVSLAINNVADPMGGSSPAPLDALVGFDRSVAIDESETAGDATQSFLIIGVEPSIGAYSLIFGSAEATVFVDSGRSFDDAVSALIDVRPNSTGSDSGDAWAAWSGGSQLGSQAKIGFVGANADALGGEPWNTAVAPATFLQGEVAFSGFTGIVAAGTWVSPYTGNGWGQLHLITMANLLTSQGLS